MFYNKKFRLMGIAATLELDVGHGVKPWVRHVKHCIDCRREQCMVSETGLAAFCKQRPDSSHL